MITILPLARKDLASGFAFYESQEPGLGSFFMESLFSDIDSLKLYAGIHPKVFNYHRFLAKRFTLPFITQMKRERFWLRPFLTAAATRYSSDVNLKGRSVSTLMRWTSK